MTSAIGAIMQGKPMGNAPTYQSVGSTYRQGATSFAGTPYQTMGQSYTQPLSMPGTTTMAAPSTQYMSSATQMSRPMPMPMSGATYSMATPTMPTIPASPAYSSYSGTPMATASSSMFPTSGPITTQAFAAPQTFGTTAFAAPQTFTRGAPQMMTTAATQYVTSSPYTTTTPSAGRVVSTRIMSQEEYMASQVQSQVIIPEAQIVTEQFVEQVAAEEAVAESGPIEGLMNQAFVFIKPHANTELTVNTTRDMLSNFGIAIAGEGDLTSDIIDERKMIDQHYYSIASKATILKPDQLPVDSDKFEAVFGIPWEAALPTAYNAMDAMQALESNVEEISELWAAAKDNKKLVKLGGGFYCGLIEKPGFQPIYTFNAFFMNMRSEYVAPGNSIHWFAVEWDERSLPWADFRGQVLGPTDPADAPEGSIRGMILANWQELGLAQQPNTGLNGVHASASPLEALYERMNWLGIPCEEDIFGNYLLQLGVPPEFIDAYAVDPQVNLPEEKVGSIWDHLEDSDASTCVDKFVQVVNINMAAADAEGA